MALDVGALCVVLNFVFASVLLCFAVLLFVFKIYPLSHPFCTRVRWKSSHSRLPTVAKSCSSLRF